MINISYTRDYIDPLTMAQCVLTAQSLNGSKQISTVLSLPSSCRLKQPATVEDLYTQVQKAGYKLLRRIEAHDDKGTFMVDGPMDVWVRYRDDGLLEAVLSLHIFSYKRTTETIYDAPVHLKVETTSPHKDRELAEWFHNNTCAASLKKSVNYITQKGCGGEYEIRKLPYDSVSLDDANYTPEVLSQFQHCVGALNGSKNGGSLIIIDGPPGTGKTYFTRNLIDKTDALHILIPADMVGRLDGPELFGLLIKLKDNAKDKAIVLVVEDADSCVIPRGVDNMSHIRSILNLTDGIIGKSLGINMILTTNAKRSEFDDALLRQGRCLAHIKIDALPVEQCVKFLASNGVTNVEIHKPTVLADLYQIVRNHNRG